MKPLELLLPYARTYRLQITVALVAIGVAASTLLVFGWGLKNLIDRGFSKAGGGLSQ